MQIAQGNSRYGRPKNVSHRLSRRFHSHYLLYSDGRHRDRLTLLRDTENLGETSTDYIGHYLDNPNFVDDHGEIEPSLEHKGNRPTERASLQAAASQNDYSIRILLRKSPVLSPRKGKIHYAATIYLQSYEGKTGCSALFRYVASEKQTWPRKIDEIVSIPGSRRLEALNSLWVTHSTYTTGLGRLPVCRDSFGSSSTYRHGNSPLFDH
jgi:hypothetical protein